MNRIKKVFEKKDKIMYKIWDNLGWEKDFREIENINISVKVSNREGIAMSYFKRRII